MVSHNLYEIIFNTLSDRNNAIIFNGSRTKTKIRTITLEYRLHSALEMDADDFRDYILGFIFYKCLSTKMDLYANTILKHEQFEALIIG